MEKRIVLTTVALLVLTLASAQKLVVKSNLLYDATTTLNLGIEAPLAAQWTVDLSANYNPWTFARNRKLKHYLLQPELRYWMRRRFDGHFVGLHTAWGVYNASRLPLPGVTNAKEYRYEGWITGAGLAYGYAMPIGKRWNIEFTVAAGWVYTRYDQFKCSHCGEKVSGQLTASRFAPTKAGISLIYILKDEPDKKATPPTDTEASTPEQLARERQWQEQQTQKQEIENQKALQAQLAQQAQEAQQVQQRQALADSLHKAQEAPRRFAIRFATGKTQLSPDLGNNQEAIAQIVALLASRQATYTLEITGYASPEGGLQHNQRLATRRAQALKAYLRKQLPQLPDSAIVTRCGGEDWEGLRQLVAQDTTMQHREKVLRIIDNVPVSKGREKQLMDLKGGRPYFYMMDKLFPTLRSVSYRSLSPNPSPVGRGTR